MIGAIWLQPERVSDLAADLKAEDFYVPRHQQLWAAWQEIWNETASKPDLALWAIRAKVDAADILPIMSNAVGFGRHHVEIIKEHRLRRDIMAHTFEARSRAGQLDDPADILRDLESLVERQHDVGIEPQAMTIWELEESAEGEAPWIVPGCLRKDWRTVVVGEEGAGKGVLLRCFAIATAGGLHPFTHNPIPARRTLLVDLENPKAAVLETGLIVANTVKKNNETNGEITDPTAFRIWHQPAGIDIRNPQDRALLVREIVAQQPELVCIGPWYKMTRKRPNEDWESAAMGALQVIDRLRIKYGFAVMIEAHSPKPSSGSKRLLLPIGSVYLTAWPEVGIGLRRNEDNELALDVEHFRGSRMKENWPQRIERHGKMVIRGFWDNREYVDF